MVFTNDKYIGSSNLWIKQTFWAKKKFDFSPKKISRSSKSKSKSKKFQKKVEVEVDRPFDFSTLKVEIFRTLFGNS